MPIKLGGRRLGEWLSRAGASFAQQPLPYNDYVQPVEVVGGDGWKLTSPQIPPSAVAGSDQLMGAAANYACQLQSLAPGGCWIEDFSLSGVFAAPIARGWAWWVDGPNPNALTLCPAFNMGPTPVLSRFFTGQPATIATSQFQPMGFMNAAAAPPIRLTDIYVPPGSYFLFESNTTVMQAGDLVGVYCKWREYSEPA